MDSLQWGRRIKAFRKLKGYTQVQFAKKVGISVSLIGEVERGNREPSHELLTKTTQVLGIALEELQPTDKNRE